MDYYDGSDIELELDPSSIVSSVLSREGQAVDAFSRFGCGEIIPPASHGRGPKARRARRSRVKKAT